MFFLKYKFEVLNAFIKFFHIIEKFINRLIKSFQSNWRGDFQGLSFYLQNIGIAQRISCPKTLEQNSCVEYKHRDIVETSLSPLQHSSTPLKFWEHAFDTVIYLINQLLTPTLHNKSP